MVKDFKTAASQGPKRDFKQGAPGGGFKKSFGGPPRGGNFGGRGGYEQGPPERVEAVCEFSHTCGEQIIVKATNVKKVPKFNRGIYLENKTKVGTVDEILGPIDGFFYSINLVSGVTADSYKVGDKFYMGWEDTLPIDRFLPKPKGAPKSGGPRRGPGGPGGPGGFNKGGFNKGGPGGFNKGGPGGFNRGGAGGFNKGGFNKGAGGNAGGYKKSFVK